MRTSLSTLQGSRLDAVRDVDTLAAGRAASLLARVSRMTTTGL